MVMQTQKAKKITCIISHRIVGEMLRWEGYVTMAHAQQAPLQRSMTMCQNLIRWEKLLSKLILIYTGFTKDLTDLESRDLHDGTGKHCMVWGCCLLHLSSTANISSVILDSCSSFLSRFLVKVITWFSETNNFFLTDFHVSQNLTLVFIANDYFSENHPQRMKPFSSKFMQDTYKLTRRK